MMKVTRTSRCSLVTRSLYTQRRSNQRSVHHCLGTVVACWPDLLDKEMLTVSGRSLVVVRNRRSDSSTSAYSSTAIALLLYRPIQALCRGMLLLLKDLASVSSSKSPKSMRSLLEATSYQP